MTVDAILEKKSTECYRMLPKTHLGRSCFFLKEHCSLFYVNEPKEIDDYHQKNNKIFCPQTTYLVIPITY